ncbi:ATP-dependent protease subunit HslV [Candidatus Cardinium hertigii]|nr:ATP-dependent protease subunit HslV [Candidatus Cardinium hertigii]
MLPLHATTVLVVLHKGSVVIGSDGQATLGNTIAKHNVKKVRKLFKGSVLAGFAGSTADAFTILERFEEKLQGYRGNIKRAAIELAKDWRTDRMLKRLEAMLLVANQEDLLMISGNGDVLEPDYPVAAIGSGSVYAQSAARALVQHAPHLTAMEIVRESLTIAADICIYTNHNFVFEELNETEKQL